MSDFDIAVLVGAGVLAVLTAWFVRQPSTTTRQLADALLLTPPEAVGALLARHPTRRAVDGLHRAVRDLSIDDRLLERPDLVELLVERDPVGALGPALELARAGLPAPAERACRGVLRDNPANIPARDGLATLRFEAGDLDGALAMLDGGPRDDPWLRMTRARIEVERGRPEEASRILRDVLTSATAHARTGSDPAYWSDVENRADRMRQMLLRDLEGDEAVLRDAASSGRLQPNSGTNHTLVGLAAMARSPRVARRLLLGSVEEALADRDGDPRSARVREGEARLRQGDSARAKELFRRLVEEDPSFFPGQLGLGAALSLEEHNAVRNLTRLPHEVPGPEWVPVVPDLPVLTDLEKRVVAASVEPLRRALPGLLAAGVQIRLLPIDVRTTDLEAFEHLEHSRLGTRAMAGIQGLASTSGLAVARIEGLLDTSGPGSWVFAHELAHLAFWCLPEEDRASFEALYVRERETAWAFTEYQQQNIDEFFAVSLEDWLREQYGHVSVHLDSSGAWGRVRGWFDAFRQ